MKKKLIGKFYMLILKSIMGIKEKIQKRSSYVFVETEE